MLSAPSPSSIFALGTSFNPHGKRTITISPIQYRENSQLRHKWVLSLATSCADKETMTSGRDIHPIFSTPYIRSRPRQLLAEGIYEGAVQVVVLRNHGDLGLGTFLLNILGCVYNWTRKDVGTISRLHPPWKTRLFNKRRGEAFG